MTTKTHKVVRYILWSIPILLGIMILWGMWQPPVTWHKSHVFQIREVSLALKLYADDHEGILPNDLGDLLPTYLARREMLDQVEYVTAGAKLPELSPTAVIARRPYPEDRLVGEAHADTSVVATRY